MVCVIFKYHSHGAPPLSKTMISRRRHARQDLVRLAVLRLPRALADDAAAAARDVAAALPCGAALFLEV